MDLYESVIRSAENKIMKMAISFTDDAHSSSPEANPKALPARSFPARPSKGKLPTRGDGGSALEPSVGRLHHSPKANQLFKSSYSMRTDEE